MGIPGNVPLTDIEGARLWGALMQGPRELSYVEGQNLIVEHLSTEGRSERLPALSTQLVRWKPDVIVVPSTPNALASRKATQTIPIVAATLSTSRSVSEASCTGRPARAWVPAGTHAVLPVALQATGASDRTAPQARRPRDDQAAR